MKSLTALRLERNKYNLYVETGSTICIKFSKLFILGRRSGITRWQANYDFWSFRYQSQRKSCDNQTDAVTPRKHPSRLLLPGSLRARAPAPPVQPAGGAFLLFFFVVVRRRRVLPAWRPRFGVHGRIGIARGVLQSVVRTLTNCGVRKCFRCFEVDWKVVKFLSGSWCIQDCFEVSRPCDLELLRNSLRRKV